MASPESELLTERVATALVVTLNRPHRANALSGSLMQQLRILWSEVARDPSIRSVILTGAGSAFCGGADMALLASDRTEVGADAAEELSFVPGPRLDVPVIVAVNGSCAGGGLHFVADADICIASENATFIDPHVSVGQVSGLEPLELVLRMRRDAAVRMALLGRTEVLDAHRALACGLVSEVVAPSELRDTALGLAERIATGSPAAIRATRASIRDLEADMLRTHLDAGWRRVQEHWAHPDSKEGPAAFSEKRAPRWELP
nr:enoyl-CoA hydratase/isomerase family protein [Microbacterium bovistercoris]